MPRYHTCAIDGCQMLVRREGADYLSASGFFTKGGMSHSLEHVQEEPFGTEARVSLYIRAYLPLGGLTSLNSR